MEENPLYLNNVFSISPMANRIALRPGEVATGSLKIVNPNGSGAPVSYEVSLAPYSFDENNNPDFDTKTTYSDIIDWIEIENPTGEIPVNSSAIVNYTITVPKDASGGGQYCSLSVRNNATAPDGSDSTVKIKDTMEISSLIYATISGDIIREGEIIENSVPIISFKNPVRVSAGFKNSGKVHQDARVLITAKSFFTGEEIFSNATDNGNARSSLVMPGQTTVEYNDITELANLGIYNITQQVTFDGKTSVVEKITLVTPIWFICLVVAMIFGIIFSIIGSIKKHRRLHSYKYKK